MDCFWWKLAFGIIAFGLAFCIMTVMAFYNDVIHNNEKIESLKETICKLYVIIDYLEGKPYFQHCPIPSDNFDRLI